MRSKAFDVFLIVISGIIAVIISSYNPRADKAEMDALWLYVFPAMAAIITIVLFAIFNMFFKRLYNNYRWWLVAMFAAVNLLVGFIMYFYQLP